MKRRKKKMIQGSNRPVGHGWGFKAGALRNRIKRTQSGSRMRLISRKIRRSGKASRYVSRFR